jgi:hypothetical protein
LTRSGYAAWIQDDTRGARGIRDNGDQRHEAGGADLDPWFLHVAGDMLAWRYGEQIVVHDLGPDAPGTREPGPLMRIGDVFFDAAQPPQSGWQIYARVAGGRRVALGAPWSFGWSSSFADGLDALLVSGSFVAVRDTSYSTGSPGPGEVRVFDLARGTQRTLCRAEVGVGAFILTEAGRVACVTSIPFVNRIESEGVVLDQGRGVDGLARRGDRLVWLHDGVERSAPLP